MFPSTSSSSRGHKWIVGVNGWLESVFMPSKTGNTVTTRLTSI
jgi:hypothetical protein